MNDGCEMLMNEIDLSTKEKQKCDTKQKQQNIITEQEKEYYELQIRIRKKEM